MSTNALKKLRSLTPLTQHGFAGAMGVPLRTYEDLESGRTPLRPVHVKAAQWAALETAAENPVAAHLSDDLINIAADALENVARRDPCPVCIRPRVRMAERTGGDYSQYQCDNCGTFRISGTAEAMWPNAPRINRYRSLANAEARIAPDSGEIPMISSTDLN